MAVEQFTIACILRVPRLAPGGEETALSIRDALLGIKQRFDESGSRAPLNLRGDVGTGFGPDWKAACWLRLLDGEHASLCLTRLVARQTCPNLLSKCFKAPQVDGAMGATAAIAEMLLQSYEGDIHLLPVLPRAWPTGSAKGLRARGGFEVDQQWKDRKLVTATIRSWLESPCSVRLSENVVQFATQRGEVYRLGADLSR